MKLKILGLTFLTAFLLASSLPGIVQATTPQSRDDIRKDFSIDISGYETYSFGAFNQLGYKITPLTQLYLWIIQREGEWIDEPILYLKGNKGYFHLWKKDGTNVLYTVEKQTSGPLKDTWKIIDVKRIKINRIPVPKILLKEALIERLVVPISDAINVYGKGNLWSRGEEKILKIDKDEQNLYVTVQVITFEGAHNPPYGEETIIFKIRGSKINVVNYKHRDIPKEDWSKIEPR